MGIKKEFKKRKRNIKKLVQPDNSLGEKELQIRGEGKD